MDKDLPGAFVAELSWAEVEERVQAGAVAVLPVGASSKEHGLHLPMKTDMLQAEWLADVLVQSTKVLVWPNVNYGYYPTFTEYPGSVSLSDDTFQRMVSEILSSILRAGVGAVLILNTGISTIAPLQAIVETLTSEWKIKLANVYEGPRYQSAADAIEEQSTGGHADELETSILLALDRQYVMQDKAEPWTPDVTTTSGPFSRDPDNPRYSPTGTWGNPTLASQEKGQRLLAAMADDLLNDIEMLQA